METTEHDHRRPIEVNLSLRNPQGAEQLFCFHLLFGSLHRLPCRDGAQFHAINVDYATLPPPTHTPQVRGLGDVVAKVTAALGIKQKPGCGCKRRQEKLNKLVPFKPGGA